MTQEDKDLLLRDLSGRLTYGVKGMNIRWPEDGCVEIHNMRANEQKVQIFEDWCDISECMLYLRPMSSMTEEEKLMYEGLMIGTDNISYMLDVIDWLNANHFDYRGLIEKCLAIEAPEEMYNFKNQ